MYEPEQILIAARNAYYGGETENPRVECKELWANESDDDSGEMIIHVDGCPYLVDWKLGKKGIEISNLRGI